MGRSFPSFQALGGENAVFIVKVLGVCRLPKTVQHSQTPCEHPQVSRFSLPWSETHLLGITVVLATSQVG
ncbi:hypothetical protein N0V93_001309 [Gnomoniopsis smithogilvyi]|uniref:Uncharacterized protein n=1 Tax=Gnomoniopsis smithogilvyi TaxID=1191159 RepID=A0A9W9D2H7_9PEZI|nr:hypothetical protein N0V93_001309 [Gnomoniopsis smithogilvyi]